MVEQPYSETILSSIFFLWLIVVAIAAFRSHRPTLVGYCYTEASVAVICLWTPLVLLLKGGINNSNVATAGWMLLVRMLCDVLPIALCLRVVSE